VLEAKRQGREGVEEKRRDWEPKNSIPGQLLKCTALIISFGTERRIYSLEYGDILAISSYASSDSMICRQQRCH